MTALVHAYRDVADELAPAGLEEIQANASLMTRTDRKYVVPAEAMSDLVAAIALLDANPRVLEIDGRRRHRYSSTYLDTPDLEGYWRAARQRRHRFKVRSRHYVDHDASFTEVKTRGPRGSTVKTRVPRGVGREAVSPDVLPDQDARFVRSELADAGLAHVDVDSLVPTLRTDYTRTTLWLPGSGARVTIDVDLVWSLPWSGIVARVPGLAVVETKTSRAGTGIDRPLWARGHRPVRLSKYGAGLALLVPGLPAHRWHRVLTRHLRPLTRQD